MQDLDIGQEVSEVAEFLKDEDVKEFGLQAEIITWALINMRRNPKLTPAEALNHALMEWVK